MDNWFVCWGVVLFCLASGVQMVGTLRAGRKFFPSKASLTLPNDAARGTTKIFRHSQENVYACVWKDNKLVRLVSTFPYGIGTCVRAQREGGYSKSSISQPQCVGCYNGVMGGCDLGDQCKAYIRPVIRSRVRTRFSFYYRVSLSVCVSFSLSPPRRQSSMLSLSCTVMRCM